MYSEEVHRKDTRVAKDYNERVSAQDSQGEEVLSVIFPKAGKLVVPTKL